MDYTDKTLNRFKNPNFAGDVENADGIGEEGNFKCGDMMRISIKIKDDIIKEIKFKTYGCVSAIASTDMLCEIATGMTLEKAKKITAKQIAEGLGGLPPIKVHCSVMGHQALNAAIDDYEYKKSNKEKEIKMENKEKITKEMNINKIIQNNPDTIQVFMNNGIHCIGCAAANFETLEQGLKAHGADDEKVKKFVEELNKAKKDD